MELDDKAVAGQDWTFLQGAVQLVQSAEAFGARLQVTPPLQDDCPRMPEATVFAA
jgi:hypothetical protein